MDNQRNLILAIALSLAVLFVWQFFIAGPQLDQAQKQQAAQQMGQGRLQPLKDVAIHLRVLTQNLKLHFLAQRAGQITHHARKPADPIAKRAHAGAEHFEV